MEVVTENGMANKSAVKAITHPGIVGSNEWAKHLGIPTVAETEMAI